jgi:signal transduction histidine kinase
VAQRLLSEQQVDLQNKNTSLNNSLQQLEQFTHIVSHDVKNPLSNLINLVQLIEKETLSSFNQEMVENISKSVDKLDWVVKSLNKILASKKLDALPPEPTNLSFTIKSINNDLANLYAESGTKVSSKISENTTVMMPGVHVNSVIQNMITNAVKYTPKSRKPIIKIESGVDNGQFYTDFKDNGIGIDKSYWDSIFEAFMRIDNKIPGDGIGLFIVKSTLLKYGGNIFVHESKLGKGTTIRVIWPKDSNNVS